jgi:hypothetical protein
MAFMVPSAPLGADNTPDDYKLDGGGDQQEDDRQGLSHILHRADFPFPGWRGSAGPSGGNWPGCHTVAGCSSTFCLTSAGSARGRASVTNNLVDLARHVQDLLGWRSGSIKNTEAPRPPPAYCGVRTG